MCIEKWTDKLQYSTQKNTTQQKKGWIANIYNINKSKTVDRSQTRVHTEWLYLYKNS